MTAVSGRWRAPEIRLTLRPGRADVRGARRRLKGRLMRYRGNRRQAEMPADVRGRHRRPRRRSATPRVRERPPGRPRRLQPRDALGRFRKIEPADLPGRRRTGGAGAGRRGGRAAAYTWRDFELDEDLPRAAPHPPDVADLRDGRRHCGALEGILYRQWAADGRAAPPDAVRAVDSLAELPDALKEQARRSTRRDLCRLRWRARSGRHAISARRTLAIRKGDLGHLRGRVRRSDDRRRGPTVTDAGCYAA